MLRKNVAGQFICFQGVSASTGGILSGATWTMRRCLDGTFAAGGATITEDSTNGWYKAALTQADTNGNNVSYNFTATGAIPQTINDTTTAADPTNAATFGITDIDATISSRLASASYTAPTNLTAAQIATSVWQDATAGDFTAANSIGKSVMNGVALGTGLTVNAVTTVNGLANNVITAASIAASALNGKGDWLLSSGYTAPLSAAGTRSALGMASANLDTQLAAIDSDVLTRMAAFTLPTNFSALAITAGGAVTAGTVSDKTGYSLTSAEENAIADAILNRNVAGGSSTGRLVKEALYVLRNKVDTGAGTVYGTDDITPAFTFTVTTAAGNPITVFDPA